MRSWDRVLGRPEQGAQLDSSHIACLFALVNFWKEICSTISEWFSVIFKCGRSPSTSEISVPRSVHGSRLCPKIAECLETTFHPLSSHNMWCNQVGQFFLTCSQGCKGTNSTPRYAHLRAHVCPFAQCNHIRNRQASFPAAAPCAFLWKQLQT